MASRKVYCRVDGLWGCRNPLHNFSVPYGPEDGVSVRCYRCGTDRETLARMLLSLSPDELRCWCQIDKASTLRHMEEMTRRRD